MKRIIKYISHIASALLRTKAQPAVPAAFALALSLLAAGSLSVACNKEPAPTPQDGKYAIAFDEVGVDTKAAITATDGISEFKVWGAVKENSDDADYANIFTGSIVEYKMDSEGNFGWIYEGEQYWKEDSKYRFFAVSPTSYDIEYDESTLTYNVDYTVPGQFNVPDAQFNDIVVAGKTVETLTTLERDPGKVDMLFKHPITKVNLHIAKSNENSDDKMVVTDVSLAGMRNSGTYKYYLETGLTEWTFGTSTSSLIYEGEDYEVNVDEYIGENDDDEGWLKLQFYALPQYISDNTVRLQISYTYTESTGTETDTKSYSVYLPQTDVWKENNIVTYKVELSADHKIRFYIYQVDTWGLMPSGTVIIQ